MMDGLHRLYRRRVEVVAHGISYTGLFLGADEDFLYLIGPSSYLTIPLEAVAAVREEGEDEGSWLRREIAGAPPREPDRVEEKRRFDREAYQKFFAVAAPRTWPEPGGPDREED